MKKILGTLALVLSASAVQATPVRSLCIGGGTYPHQVLRGPGYLVLPDDAIAQCICGVSNSGASAVMSIGECDVEDTQLRAIASNFNVARDCTANNIGITGSWNGTGITSGGISGVLTYFNPRLQGLINSCLR